jgi:hypothetical protein
VIDAALFRQFPALTPYDIVDAWEASASFRKRDLHRQEVLLAVFQTWADIHKERGRPEDELMFGQCVDELGIREERGGGQYINLQKLARVADVEMRRATLAAAWKAAEEDKAQ